MDPSDTRHIVAENLERLLKRFETTTYRLAKDTEHAPEEDKLSQRQVHDMLQKREHFPRTDRLAAVAKAFGLEAWQLLVPLREKPVENLLDVYCNKANERERQGIDIMVRMILDRFEQEQKLEKSRKQPPPKHHHR